MTATQAQRCDESIPGLGATIVVVAEHRDAQSLAAPSTNSSSLMSVLQQVLEASDLPRAHVKMEERGVGVTVVVNGRVSPESVIGEFVRHLDAELARENRRCRIAVHHGLAILAGGRWVGAAVEETYRLIDTALLRDTLGRARRGHIALITSDTFFRSAVRPGRRAVDPSTFAPLTLTGFDEERRAAWIQVPGYAWPPALPVETGPQSADPEPESPQPTIRPSSGSVQYGGFNFAGASIQMYGDMLEGDKVAYQDRRAPRRAGDEP